MNLVTKCVFMKSPSLSNSARACSRGSYSRTNGSLRATTSAILASNGGEVFGREGLLAIEVVEEAGVGCGAVAKLGLRKELEDSRGQDVRGGVAQNFQRVGIVFFH